MLKFGQFNMLELPKYRRSYDNETAVIAGYGYNWVFVEYDLETNEIISNERGSTDGHTLRYAETVILPKNVCKTYYTNFVYNSHICARMKEPSDGTCGVSIMF